MASYMYYDELAENTTYNESPPPTIPTSDVLLATVTSIFCLISLIGNGIDCYFVTRILSMRTVQNIFLLSMSMPHILYCLILQPVEMITMLLRGWIFNVASCKMYQMLKYLFWFMSSYTILFLVVDRFFFMYFPIIRGKYIVPRSTGIFICVMWVLAVIFMIPIGVFANVIGPVCTILPWSMDDDLGSTYVLYCSLSAFFIPLCFTFIFGILISVKFLISVSISQKRENIFVNNHYGMNDEDILVAVIVFIFIVLCCPFWILLLYQMFHPSGAEIYDKWYYLILYKVLGVLNWVICMIFPFIYLCKKEFRDCYRKIFRCNWSSSDIKEEGLKEDNSDKVTRV